MRLQKRNLLVAIIISLLTYIGVAAIEGHQWTLALVAPAAILSVHFLAALADWMLFEPLGAEYQQTRHALRQAELTFGIALGELSPNRSPRKWWRPIYLWRLKRKLAGMGRLEAT